jgi:hypothetical protein
MKINRPAGVHPPDCDCAGCTVATVSHEQMESTEAPSTQAGTGAYETTHQRHSRHFQKKRPDILDRDGRRCRMPGCDVTNEEHRARDDLWPESGGLHVHHIRPAKCFETPEDADRDENLISLCAEHHRAAELGVRPCPRP